MKTWYAKTMSEMTNVSVRTLHHYDKIGLLTPSGRRANSYRVYSEEDLSKLQRIIALKFFGFELSQIKFLLENDVDMAQHLQLQADYLEKEAKALHAASNVLQHVVSECGNGKSISWQKTLELIEVYQMSKHIEHEWVREVLNQDELAEYVQFEKSLTQRFTKEEHQQFEKNWAELVEEIKQHINEDPTSKKSIAIGKRCMKIVNQLYGREFAGLRTALWEKGMKHGKDNSEHGLSIELATWLDKAIEAYWVERIFGILNQITPNTPKHLRDDWNDLIDEMFGSYQQGVDEFMQILLADKRVSKAQREWLLA